MVSSAMLSVTSVSIIFEYVAAKILLQYYRQTIVGQYQSRLYVGFCIVHWLQDYTQCTLMLIGPCIICIVE